MPTLAFERGMVKRAVSAAAVVTMAAVCVCAPTPCLGVTLSPGDLVVTDVVSSEVVALVGGRQMHYAGFNRALDAVRPMGSLAKPAVYLAALESKRYTLTTRLDDTPVDVKVPGGRWQPKNYDKQFHGAVPLHRALSESYNAATAHLGLELGVPKVLATIQRLGVERDLAG